ncbi:hypothetical protein PHYSODRAFT_255996, partial [Phytophthora sojae]
DDRPTSVRIDGSVREGLDVLEARIRESGTNWKNYKWYLELRSKAHCHTPVSISGWSGSSV